MNSYNQMPISYLKPQFDLWVKYLSTHQSANLFFLKNTGILPRLYQFRDYCRQKKIEPTPLHPSMLLNKFNTLAHEIRTHGIVIKI